MWLFLSSNFIHKNVYKELASTYLGPIVAEVEHRIFVSQGVAWRLRLTTAHCMSKHAVQRVCIRCCSSTRRF